MKKENTHFTKPKNGGGEHLLHKTLKFLIRVNEVPVAFFIFLNFI